MRITREAAVRTSETLLGELNEEMRWEIDPDVWR